MINLGDTVRDEVTGYTGVVLARMEALHEATQCRVHHRELKSDGELQAGVWLEETRLKALPAERLCGFAQVVGKR